MVLAKAEGRVADYYSSRLVEPKYQGMSKFLTERLDICIKSILSITEGKEILERDPVVRRAIEARLPFTNALNLMQVEVLKLLRSGVEGEARRYLEDAMVVTIQGIASGMGTFLPIYDSNTNKQEILAKHKTTITL